MNDEMIERVYQQVCRAGNPETAVAGLDDQALRALTGWLARLGEQSGIPSLIHGLAMHEISERFMKLGATTGGKE